MEKMQNLDTKFGNVCERRMFRMNEVKSTVMMCCNDESLGGAEIVLNDGILKQVGKFRVFIFQRKVWMQR